MNHIPGTGLYDGLNKFVVGGVLLFLILLFFSRSSFSELLRFQTEGSVGLLALTVLLAWLTGVVFWAICLFINSWVIRLIPPLQSNYKPYIDQAANRVYGRIFGRKVNVRISKTRYLLEYYSVQKANLLGNVSILESYSQFSKNFSILGFFATVAFLIRLMVVCRVPGLASYDLSHDLLYTGLSAFTVILFGRLYKKLEIQIKEMVIEAYFFSRIL